MRSIRRKVAANSLWILTLLGGWNLGIIVWDVVNRTVTVSTWFLGVAAAFVFFFAYMSWRVQLMSERWRSEFR